MSLIAGFRNFPEKETTLLTGEKMLAAFPSPYGNTQGELLPGDSFTFLHKKGACQIFRQEKKLLLLEGFLTGRYKEKDLFTLREKYGWEKTLSMLEGSFLLICYDEEKETLTLATDPMGTKSLYWFSRGGHFAFAGNLSLLKCHKECPTQWDEQSLWDYLSFGCLVGENTHMKGVKRLLPGTILQVPFSREGESGLLLKKRYWKVASGVKLDLSYPELCQLCREKLFNATNSLVEKARLLTGKDPVLFLSGGLDSAIISALALECTSAPLKSCSISFEDPAYDEGPLAGETAQFLRAKSGGRLEHRIRKVKGEELFGRLEKLVCFTGLPYADSSLLPTSLLCSLAAEEGENFALNGDGADELYGGYERYIAMELYRKLAVFPLFFRKQLYSFAQVLPGGSSGDRGKVARLKRFLKGAALPTPAERYFMLTSHAPEELKKDLAGELFEEISDTFSTFDPESFLNGERTKEEGPMLHDLTRYLACDTLPKAEIAADSAGILSTSPFLAGESLSFALALPPTAKLRGFQRKRILCDAFADKLPADLPTRKKRGFGVPVGKFFRSSWKAPLLEHLTGGVLAESGLFRKDALERLFREHEKGYKDHSYILFYLLTLSLVLEKEK